MFDKNSKQSGKTLVKNSIFGGTKNSLSKNEKERKKFQSGKLGGTMATTWSQGYDASVASRAIKRAGKNVNLKGHINEIRTVDKINSNIGNIIKGNTAKLTKSPTAVRDDIVVTNKLGNVIKRMQVKDTVSSSGVNKTAQQIASGKYNKTNIIGTVETAKAVNKSKKMLNATKTVKSNGLRTIDNERIAAKALGSAGKNISGDIKLAVSGTGKAVKNGAALTTCFETVKNANKIRKKEIDVGTGVRNVAKETLVSAGSSAAGNVVGNAVAIGMATIAPEVAVPASIIAGAVTSGVTDKGARKVMDKVIK